MPNKEKESGIINVVLKASDILDCFSPDTPELTLAQISANMNMPKSSVLNLLRTLEVCGLIDRLEPSKTYRLGYKVLTLSHAKRQALPIAQQALPYLDEIQEQTGEIVYLVTHINGRVLYLDGVYPSRRMSPYSISGKVHPMHCTSVGKAILAYLPHEEILAILDRWGMEKRTAKTIDTPEALFKELEIIRKRGYAIDNEEETPGVRCIGVAIRNRSGYPTGAISISSSVISLTDECIPGYADLIARVCTMLSPQADQLLNR